MPSPPPRPARPAATPSFTPHTRLALLALGAAAIATIHAARVANAAARARAGARTSAAPSPAARPSAARPAAAVLPPAAESTIPTPAVLPAHAHFPEPWEGLVGSDAQASAFDPSRVVIAGDTATVWVRIQFPRDVPFALTGRPGVRVMEMPYQVRCAAGQARGTGAMILLSVAGDTLGVRDAWDPRAWEPLDHTLVRVCRCLASTPRPAR